MLSDGQRALLETLADLDAGDATRSEPAAMFRPVTWAAASPPGFDLESAAQRLAADPDAARAADALDRSGGGAEIPRELPPPCAAAHRIVADVAAGESTALSWAERAIARAEACNPLINAIVTATPERARSAAAVVDAVVAEGERPRPLAGVPLLHKDIIATRGIRTTAGARLLADHIPDEDATVVGRLENAGTLLLGKANTHELATGTTGAVSVFGATRNPWSLDHMAGGSSSGSAAALAAGVVAMATGTDTGGSIRIPAACCGIVGLKPTYGRVSRAGVLPFSWSLDHVGPMARTARDAAMLLTALAGSDPFDATSATEPAGDFAADIDSGIAGVRFALPARDFLARSRPEVVECVSAAAEQLEALGAVRVDAEMPEEFALAGPATISTFLAEAGALHGRAVKTFPGGYHAETRALLQLADHVGARTYVEAQRVRRLLAEQLARYFQAVDVLVTPTLAMPAPRLDARQVEGVGGSDEPLDVRAAMTLFTRPFNLTGNPALSINCGFVEKLPVGMQLVGAPFQEALLLRVAHSYEQATDWHRQRPEGFA